MARYEATFKSFAEADGFLGERRSAKLGYDTGLRRVGLDQIVLRFKETDIITYGRDGSVLLDNGGWATRTTRERFREFTPVDVRQRGGREFWIANDKARPFVGRLNLSPLNVARINAGAVV